MMKYRIKRLGFLPYLANFSTKLRITVLYTEHSARYVMFHALKGEMMRKYVAFSYVYQM